MSLCISLSASSSNEWNEPAAAFGNNQYDILQSWLLYSIIASNKNNEYLTSSLRDRQKHNILFHICAACCLRVIVRKLQIEPDSWHTLKLEPIAFVYDEYITSNEYLINFIFQH